MFFRRKLKNRRFEREHILDVKLRSSQVRAARTRLAAVILGVVFASVLGLYLSWRGGQWALDRLVYRNPAFSLDCMDLQTDGIIAVSQLRRWTGVGLGENLLGLDLAQVKRNLESRSMVQSASLERVLPHTLRIRVIEREPVAQVLVPRPRAQGGAETAVVQLDADGWVMVPLDPRQRATPSNQPTDQLPIITGLNANEVQDGHRLESPPAQAALKLLVAFNHSSLAGLVDLKRIDVSAPQVLVVSTGQGSEVTLSTADPEQQLRRWQSIYEFGRKMGKAIASLDLAVTNNIPARWLEASAVPAGTPKPPRTWKKKHV